MRSWVTPEITLKKELEPSSFVMSSSSSENSTGVHRFVAGMVTAVVDAYQVPLPTGFDPGLVEAGLPIAIRSVSAVLPLFTASSVILPTPADA